MRSTMSRPDPIEYAERLYAAIRAASFSPISFLAFGNAVKDGVELRRMPRIAAEPFMRVVGEMLDLEEEVAEGDILEADVLEQRGTAVVVSAETVASPAAPTIAEQPHATDAIPEARPIGDAPASQTDRHRNGSEP